MGWPVQSSCSRISADRTVTRTPSTAVTLLQRGTIVFDGRTETMVVHFLYSGHGDLFGCVGTVPSQAYVKPVNRTLFGLLDETAGIEGFASFGKREIEPHLQARQQDLVNLELQRSIEQMKEWKERNGFRKVTKSEDTIFQHYLKEDMIFLTALVPYGYPCEAARTVNVWTQPVQVTFESNRVLYPLLGSKVEDGTHTYVSLDLLTTEGRPVDIPAPFDVVSEGDAEIGYRRYNHTRIEAKIELEKIEEDLEIAVGAGTW
jgi:hypothetical protein